MGKKKHSKPKVQDEWPIRCACGQLSEIEGKDEVWIKCDFCGMWQHNVCMGLSVYNDEVAATYGCEICSPERHENLLKATAKGQELWRERQRTHEENKLKAMEEVMVEQKTRKFPLTKSCHHYTNESELDWDIQKYWQQRNKLWSRYDEGDGIYMTVDSWFGVTPEPVANKVAVDLESFASPSKTVVIDIFAGVGGNAIAFALSNRWSQVIAVEIDLSTIACGQHNAAIYGVAHKITWVNEDCFKYLRTECSSLDQSKTVIFASPPWGGPGYTSDPIFKLNTMQPYSLNQIHEACKGMDCALYLPRTSDLRQISKLAPKANKIDVVQYCMDGASKALVAYIPAAGS